MASEITYVWMSNVESGGVAEFPIDAVPYWQDRGWVVTDAPAPLPSEVPDSLLVQIQESRDASVAAQVAAQAAANSIQRGQPNGIAPLDADARLPLTFQEARLAPTALAQTILAAVDAEVPIRTGPALVKQTASDLQAPRRWSFARSTSNPIFSSTSAGTTSLKTWCVIKMAGILSSPLDTYYAYFAQDHFSAGGIYLATGPTPEGPWTYRQQVFVDTTVGDQTDTPAVLWNDNTGLFHLIYQQRGMVNGQQSTGVATSPDGVNWTRVGPVFPAQPSTDPLGGHMGGLHPFRIGNRWYGYHIMGATAGFLQVFGLSYSDDGLNWATDRRPLGWQSDVIGDNDRRIVWWTSTVVELRGGLYWVGTVSDFGGGTTPRNAYLAMAPIAPDLRSLLAKPQPIWQATPGTYPWESVDVRSMHALVDGTRLYVYWTQGDGSSVGVVSADIGGF